MYSRQKKFRPILLACPFNRSSSIPLFFCTQPIYFTIRIGRLRSIKHSIFLYIYLGCMSCVQKRLFVVTAFLHTTQVYVRSSNGGYCECSIESELFIIMFAQPVHWIFFPSFSVCILVFLISNRSYSCVCSRSLHAGNIWQTKLIEILLCVLVQHRHHIVRVEWEKNQTSKYRWWYISISDVK